MKAFVSILENNEAVSSSAMIKSKITVSTVPRALIIKLEDINPFEVYNEMKEKSGSSHYQEQSSEWYRSNRSHCIDYLRKSCDEYKLRDNTFFAALSYADRALRESAKLPLKAYDIIIISCLVLATKYAENDAYELDLNDFHSLEGNNVYNLHDIKEREVKTIQELQYDLNSPTAYDFLVCQMACGVIFKDEFPDKRNVSKFYSHSKSLLSQVMSSKWGIVYSPEVLALCVITYSRRYFELNKNRVGVIKDKLHFNQNVKYEECLQDISDVINVNATFSFKSDSQKHIPKKLKPKNQLYMSNPEVLSQIKRTHLRNKLQITPRTINTIKVQTFENNPPLNQSKINTNTYNRPKPLDSTCSTFKPECSNFDTSKAKASSTAAKIKPKNMSTSELFSFKSNVPSFRNQRLLLTNCNLPIINIRNKHPHC